MRIFVTSGIMEHSANFGWQNKDDALYGIKEGYKNSADDLLHIALDRGDNKTLDTYIFPVIFSYRHCLEISLKHIYLRCRGYIPKGGHNLLSLWDNLKKDIIDGFILNPEAIVEVKKYKKNFIQYSLKGISLPKIRLLLKELQEANQQDNERIGNEKQVDQNAEVWRYLLSTDEDLYFKSSHSIDYLKLKESIDYIYDVLDFVYHIVDEYLSS